MTPLSTPLPVDGISGPTPLTHSGNIRCLPANNNINYALYGPKLTNNLFSLGWIQDRGGDYRTLGRNMVSIRPDSNTDATPQLVTLTRNNLLPVDLAALQHQYGDQQQHQQHHRAHFLAHPVVAPPPGFNTTATPRLNAEQIRRADLANELHLTLNCIPDEALMLNIRLGKLGAPWNILTSADVRNNRIRRGPCLHCIAGRLLARPKPTSTSAPASRPGQHISWDPQQLTEKAHGGYTHKNTMIDEHSGFARVEGAISKTNQHLFNSLRPFIADLNSHGHRVDTAFADPEKCNLALSNQLKAIGISPTAALPGDHATRLERLRRVINEKARSTRSRLSYNLPVIYNLLLDQDCVDNLNRTVNARSYPQTPEEAVCHKRTPPPLMFGRCAMVSVPIDKRTTNAKLHQQEVKLEPKAEVGVAAGTCKYTGATLFILANGQIVPRHYERKHILPPTFVPFNWTPKTYVPNTEPPPPASTTAEDTSHLLSREATHHYHPEAITTDPKTTQMTFNTPIQPAITDIHTQHSQAIHAQAIPQQDPSLLNELRHLTGHILINPAINALLPPQQQQQQQQQPLPQQQQQQQQPQQQQQHLEHHTATTAAAPAATPPTLLLLPPLEEPTLQTTHHQQLPPPKQQTTPTPLLRSSSRITPQAPGYYKRLGTKGLLGDLKLPKQFTLAPSLLKHYDRKLILNREAALRDRNHRLALHTALPDQKFNNLPSSVPLTPATLQRNTHSLKSAEKHLPMVHLKNGVGKECNKIFDTYKALKLIQPHELEEKRLYLPALWTIRPKPTATSPDDIKARLAINGALQPPDSYGPTHAGTSDQTHRSAIIAMTLADAAHRGTREQLQILNFDLPSAFINTTDGLPRPLTGGYQLYTRLPESPILPSEYSGKLAELTGPMNGIKQANHIFDQALRQLYIQNGYQPCHSSEYTFRKASPDNPNEYFIVSMGVDDGEIVTTSPTLLTQFKQLIIQRYGHVDFVTSQGMCGTQYTYNEDGSISLGYGKYIRRILDRVGMQDQEPTLTPSLTTFFDPPENPTPASAAEHKEFQKINGELIFIIGIRHDIRMETVALCKANSHPTKTDIAKQRHLLRYLSGCPDLSITLSANPADHPNGVEIHTSSDSAHNTDSTTGGSHSAFTITVGAPGAKTSPFLAHSATDTTGGSTPLSPMESEYVTLSLTAKSLAHYRQFAEDLGFPQRNPSIMLEDNDSAIKLANSPQIPAKSRHINLKFHHIRREIQRNQVQPRHQGTQDIVADGMTKVTSPSRFLYNRSKLFPTLIDQLSKARPYYIPTPRK